MQAAKAMELSLVIVFVHKTIFPAKKKLPFHDGTQKLTVLLLIKIRLTFESAVFPIETTLFPIGTNYSRS